MLIVISSPTPVTKEASLINQLFDEASKENLLKELPMEVLSSLAYGATLAIAKFCIFGKNKFDNAVLSESINAIWDIIKR